MKIYITFFLILPILIFGQSQTENYIKTTTYKVESTSSITNPTGTQADQNITYFDGLGRPVQQVAHQQSGTGKDIVTPIEYDAFGRQEKEYLPYVPTTAASLNYKTTALTDVGIFYNIPKYESTLNPYSQKEFEASPLNRVLKQAAPGNDWKLGNGHEIRLDYQTNTNADQVRRFEVSFIGGNTENPYLEDKGIYDPSELYKTVTKDENWQAGQLNPSDHTTQEFKDKEGHIILKRSFDAGKWHDTYYVYDDYGNLTYVLPPKVFTYNSINQLFIGQSISENTQDNNTTFFTSDNSYCQFTLSQKNEDSIYLELFADGFIDGSAHVGLKSGKVGNLYFTPQLPNMTIGNIMVLDENGNPVVGGAAYIQNGELYFSSTGVSIYPTSAPYFSYSITTKISNFQANYVPQVLDRSTLNDLIYQYRYDKRNRLVEKKLPGKDWEYIVYDKLDRPVLTQNANLRTANQWLFTKYDVFNRPVYTGEYLNTVKTTRADVQFLADAGTTLSETKQAVANTINGTTTYYSNSAFPNPADLNLLTINYYDDYDFDLNGGGSVTSYTITPITNAKGLATGNKVRVLGTASWITGLTYYDAKSRPVYTYSKNDYLAVTSTVKSQFDFIGKILETTTTHFRNIVTTTIVDVFAYDQAGRLTKQTQVINGAVAPEVIVANTYDELGQLSGKKVGGKTTQGLQKVDYAYNIRGWLKSINDPNNLSQDNDLFSFGLYYNTVVNTSLTSYAQNTPLYNGNISSTSWKTNNPTAVLKQYNYTYDALNRFKNANYIENNGLNHKFSESISQYDRNGNIMSLSRNVVHPTNPNWGGMQIDNLFYLYQGNQLMKVDDSSYSTEGFKDGTNIGDDYSYDANGNMVKDINKGIGTSTSDGIAYNYLNLPTKITFNTGETIDYVYDATGIKQRKIVSTGITTDYAGGFQYENNTLKFFSHPEGFVEYNSGTFNYIYQYKDHLGNVRLSYSDSNNDGTIVTSEILEENNYYPFGLKHKDNNVVNSTHPALRYRFGGKELQDELGLNMYDYSARNYDPAIGRWMNIDPLAEKGRRWSPYNYAFDNPVYFIDPDGMWPWPSWSSVKQFASGFGSSVMGMAQGAQLHNQIIGQVKLTYNVGRSVVNGDFKRAGKQLLNSTGIPAAVNTVKSASKGDAKAIGEVAGVVATLIVVHKAGSSSSAAASESNIFSSVKAEATRVNPNVNTATLEPGPNAGTSIPARSTSQSFTAAERSAINEIGSTEGCHTCGATSSGRASGNFTPDHQPVSSLVPAGTTQDLFPHCQSCSSSQGGISSGLLRRGYNTNNVRE